MSNAIVSALSPDMTIESVKLLRRFFYLKVLVYLLLVSSPKIQAGFNVLETENLRLIYFGELHTYLVPYVTRCFENSLIFHSKLYDYNPSDKVTLFVHDFFDYGNAGASTAPRNRISLAIAPLNYAYETAPANERVNTSLNHEMVHIVAGDKAARRDQFFRTLFIGKVAETAQHPLTIVYGYLTAPRRSAPRWYHEGIATFLETWMAGGLGRALGPYDEMVFRSKVCDRDRIYDLVGLESEGTKIDFQVGVNAYLYGTRFMTYLAYQYGPESLVAWTSRTSRSKSYFASQFKEVYSRPLAQAWSEWIRWELSFQQHNLDSIRQHPINLERQLSETPLGSVSRAFYDSASGRLYVGVNYPGREAFVAAFRLSDGKISRISDIKGSALFFVTSLCFDPTTDRLFYTTDNNNWRDLRLLDPKTGKSQLLQKDTRIGDLAFNQADKSLWGVRHFNGISTLVRIPPPYKVWNQIYSWPYGKDIYDIDISPDGTWLTGALSEINGRQSLIRMRVFKLMSGDTLYETLYDFENSSPANFTFSRDGKFLYGTSYYTGVSNVFRYSIEAKVMEITSNCETGYFRPVPFSDDSLIVFRYTSRGFLPVLVSNLPLENVSAITYLGQLVVDRHPQVKSWMASSPGSIKSDSLTTYWGKYRGWKNLGVVSTYPVIEGYKDYVSWGWRIDFSEPLTFYSSNITVSYSPALSIPASEKWHWGWDFSYSRWKFIVKHNPANFYDLFGPTKSSRKGYSLGLEYTKPLLFDEPRKADFKIDVVRYSNLERLPDYQNVAASFDKFVSATADIEYRNMRTSLGAVDYEKGIKCQAEVDNTWVKGDIYPQIMFNLDYGVPVSIPHSSLWLRSSIGYAYGDGDDPFANFFLGGFGNNWIDHQNEKRYREHYSFPGVELNQIGGSNYMRIQLEWCFPPLRFRTLGIPGFYASWARSSIFATGISTNLDSGSQQRKLLDVGTQIDFRIIMLSHLNLTFSVGYAYAFEKGEPGSDEVMLSLKIM